VQEPFIEHTVNVGKSPHECYAFWRDVSNIPKFSPMLEAVRRQDRLSLGDPGGRSDYRWVEVTVDRPARRPACLAERLADPHAGVVRFEPATGGRGTLVRVMIHPPAEARGASARQGARPRTPASQVREDLRRFKSLIETGEIPTTRSQPSGRRSFIGRMTREGRQSNDGATA
jgi:uncharacterized membrane protein